MGGMMGMDFSLTIRNLTTYTPYNVEFNGLSGVFGIINVRAASEVQLEFCYRDGVTGELLDNVESTGFAVFDLDSGYGGVRKESVESEGFAEYLVSANTELDLNFLSDTALRATATTFGKVDDNPTDPMNLTPLQASRAIAFLYPLPCFVASLGVGGPPAESGRNFVFTDTMAISLFNFFKSPPPAPPGPDPTDVMVVAQSEECCYSDALQQFKFKDPSNPLVCGDSPSCVKGNWYTALETCEDMGARLCTVED
eukprot:scaffold1866_cov276-Prasinococcus_capsulatus_cf.AAC.1